MAANTKKQYGEKIVWDIAGDAAILLMIVFIYLEWWYAAGFCGFSATLYLIRYWRSS
jgi:hypothetical protein